MNVRSAAVVVMLALLSGTSQTPATAESEPPTSRAVRAETARVVNVMDFGARCDGVTIDDHAIHDAVSALRDGSTLVFPDTESGCRLTTGVTINNLNHISIVGSPRTRLVTDVADPRFTFVTVTGWTTDLRIEGVTFQGHAATAPTSGPVQMAVHVSKSATGSRMVFTGNTVTGVNSGVVIKSGSFNHCTIAGNLFSGLVGGTSGYAAVYTVSKRNLIADNHFLDCPRHDVYLSGTYPPYGGAMYNTVTGNVSINNGLAAVAIYATAWEVPVQRNLVADNVFIGSRGMAIVMSQNARDNTISDNVVSGATADFASGRGLIALNGSTAAGTHPGGNRIVHNVIAGDTGTAPGIYSQNASNNLIVGNVVIENPRRIAAIEITATGRDQVTTGTVASANVASGGVKPSVIGSASTVRETTVSGNCLAGRVVNIPPGADSHNVVSGNVKYGSEP
jgi:hypothetical protein